MVANPKKKVQVRKQGGATKLYAGLGVLAVIAAVAVVLGGGSPKADTFPVTANAPAATPEGYLLGNPNAPVQVLEWADFECPGCMQFATLTEPDVRQRLVETGQVSFRFFFFPLTEIHRSAASAAFAAACAGDQNKFWEMHDAIFHGFNDWAGGRARDPKNVFENYAERIGLDVGTWSSCYDSDKHHATIQSHVTAGVQRGVQSTPTFIIDGHVESGALAYDQFKALVDSALAKKPQPAAAPATGDTSAASR